MWILFNSVCSNEHHFCNAFWQKSGRHCQVLLFFSVEPLSMCRLMLVAKQFRFCLEGERWTDRRVETRAFSTWNARRSPSSGQCHEQDCGQVCPMLTRDIFCCTRECANNARQKPCGFVCYSMIGKFVTINGKDCLNFASMNFLGMIGRSDIQVWNSVQASWHPHRVSTHVSLKQALILYILLFRIKLWRLFRSMVSERVVREDFTGLWVSADSHISVSAWRLWPILFCLRLSLI